MTTDALTDITVRAEQWRDQPTNPPDQLEDLVTQVAHADRLLNAARDIRAHLGTQLAQRLNGVNTLTNIAGFQVERRVARQKERWDKPALLSQLVNVAEDNRVDKQTGEIRDLTQTYVDVVGRAAGISYFRRGVLKEWGLDPDKYCEFEWGQPTVRVTKAGA